MASFTEDGDEYASYTCDNASDQITKDVKSKTLSFEDFPSASGRRASTRAQSKRTEPLPSTASEELPITYQLMQLVNIAKLTGSIVRTGYGVHDFAALLSWPIARGGYFQTRETHHVGVAKYPVLATASTELSDKSYKALANELRVLSHPPLMAHRNIVKIRTIGWTRLDPVSPAWIPMIFLELADLGTLTKHLSEQQLGVDSKLAIARDVGAGLQALHACGIMHGDLKTDNILMFKGVDGKVHAKLSDFGCSYIRRQGDEHEGGNDGAEVEITAGTKPWNSPELNHSVPVRLLQNVDTYCFGLLVWRLFLNGRNPFEGLEEEEIDCRKTQDFMISDASRSLEEEHDRSMILRGGVSSQDRVHLYMRGVAMPKRCFRYCLSWAVRDRNLDIAMESLSFDRIYGTTGSVDDTFKAPRITSGSTALAFLRLFDTPQTAQVMFLWSIETIATNESISADTRADAYLQLCYAHFDSFGTTVNFEAGVTYLKEAVKLGSTTAASILDPLMAATGHTADPDLARCQRECLIKAVSDGFLFARKQLQKLDQNPETLKKAEEKRRLWMGARSAAKGGVADADFIETIFLPHNLPALRGLMGVGQDSPFSSLGVRPQVFMSLAMNTYLHAGAALAVDPDHFRNAISVVDDKMINQQDASGNTALHLAIQFGNVEIAKILLEEGAIASLANKRGETPWHWLISLDADEDVRLLAFLMMDDAEGLKKVSTDSLTMYQYAVEHGGTPLHWAVQMNRLGLTLKLLECGADPLFEHRGLSPIDQAVSSNAAQILEVLLKFATENGRDAFPTRGLGTLTATNITTEETDEALDTLLLQVVAFRPTHERLISRGPHWLIDQQVTLEILHENGYLPPWDEDNSKVRLNTFQMLSHYDTVGPEMIEAMIEIAGIFPSVAEGDAKGRFESFNNHDAVREFWDNALKGIISHSTRTPDLLHYTIHKVRQCSRSSRVEDADALLHQYCASLAADLSVVEALLEDCSSVDCTDNLGRTPLINAIRNRNFEVATYLLERGADLSHSWINRYSGERRAYILYEYAASSADIDVVPLKYLLEPLHPFPEKMPPLLIEPDSANTVLHQACRDGSPIIFDYLLSKFLSNHQLNINQPGDSGFTPLHHAAFNGHVDRAAKLCRAGADTNARSGASDQTNRTRSRPLDLCFRWFAHDKEFLNERYGLERTKEDIFLGRLRIANLLQQYHGARRADRFLIHRSAAMRFASGAAEKGMSRLLSEALRLVSKELDVRGHKDVDVPIILTNLLWHAARGGHVGAVHLLLDLGADPNQRSPKGLSLLHQVAWMGLPEVIYALVKKGGADISAEDPEGDSVGSYSMRSRDLATIRMVKSLGGYYTMPKARAAEHFGGREPPFSIKFAVKFRSEPSDEELGSNSDEKEDDDAPLPIIMGLGRRTGD